MFKMLKNERGGISSILEVTLMLVFLIGPWIWFGLITGHWYWLWFWCTLALGLGVWEIIAKIKTGRTLSQQWQDKTKEKGFRWQLLVIMILVNLGWLTLWYHLWAKYLKQAILGD